MNRRDFFVTAGLGGVGLAIGGRVAARAQPPNEPRWRTFDVTTRVEVLQASDTTRVWLPVPLPVAPYQRTAGDTYHAVGGRMVMVETTANDPDLLAAVWENGNPAVLTLTSRVSTRDHSVDLTTATVPPPRDFSDFGRFLRPTKLIPTDGIVKKTADAITRGAGTDLERARAIYEWIVDNTFRDPNVQGCGVGDVRFMLESNSLGGKCADLNALFVGLARAAGLPARGVYGLRVAPSPQGYRSLGVASDEATRAQHCRAEVYLTGFGWLPVNPADVRRVVLEEPPGNLAMTDRRVTAVRERLFGSWEMNWIAYNFAHDVTLPGSTRGPLPYFMYPQGETGKGRLDSLDADNFKYTITVKEISA
ncbi:MAG TPA: transglutaminase-like domain-containing protein [Vicinamibacterales bacterium]|nr:transglutaminase-like domain-containing protein [Vicinamibacterales bacterium]